MRLAEILEHERVAEVRQEVRAIHAFRAMPARLGEERRAMREVQAIELPERDVLDATNETELGDTLCECAHLLLGERAIAVTEALPVLLAFVPILAIEQSARRAFVDPNRDARL